MHQTPGLPGRHRGAVVDLSTPWRAQQYFATEAYETVPTLFDWNLGRKQVRLIALSTAHTLNFPKDPQRGATYILAVKQPTGGSATITFSNQTDGGVNGTWKWTGGSAPTLTTTASKIDVLTFIYDGSDMLGTSVLNF